MPITVRHDPDPRGLYSAAYSAGAGQSAARVQDMMLQAGLQAQQQRNSQQYDLSRLLIGERFRQQNLAQQQAFDAQQRDDQQQFQLDLMGQQQQAATDRQMLGFHLGNQQNTQAGIESWFNQMGQMNLTDDARADLEELRLGYKAILSDYADGMGTADAADRDQALQMFMQDAAAKRLEERQAPTPQEEMQRDLAWTDREGNFHQGLRPGYVAEKDKDGHWSQRPAEPDPEEVRQAEQEKLNAELDREERQAAQQAAQTAWSDYTKFIADRMKVYQQEEIATGEDGTVRKRTAAEAREMALADAEDEWGAAPPNPHVQGALEQKDGTSSGGVGNVFSDALREVVDYAPDEETRRELEQAVLVLKVAEEEYGGDVSQAPPSDQALIAEALAILGQHQELLVRLQKGEKRQYELAGG